MTLVWFRNGDLRAAKAASTCGRPNDFRSLFHETHEERRSTWDCRREVSMTMNLYRRPSIHGDWVGDDLDVHPGSNGVCPAHECR